MTVSLNGNDIGQIVEIALAVGGILAMLIAGLVFYLLVRPPRKAKIPNAGLPQQIREPDPLEIEEVLQVLDRMEARLETLERSVAADEDTRRIARPKETVAGVESPVMRREQ